MRVLVLNNYDLARVTAEVAAGLKPAHHLYGIDGLRARGWEVEVIPQGGRHGVLHRLGKFLARLRWPIALGDLGQQAEAWRRRSAGDVVYAPCQTQAQALSYARALGLWRVPVVTLAHHPVVTGRLAWLRRPFFRLQLRGTDRFPTLNEKVADGIRMISDTERGSEIAPVLNWGPDLDYYARWRDSRPGHGVVAAGRTGRDWRTFGRAATLAGGKAEVICLASDVGPEFENFGANVRVSAIRAESDLPYPQLLERMAQARVLAIPLHASEALAGLTSLTDALGLGKPVIMTRHALIDLDLEAEGIGRWVDAGDVAGWAAALQWFDEHPDEATAMGRRAAALASSKWNYSEFTRKIGAILSDASRLSGGAVGAI